MSDIPNNIIIDLLFLCRFCIQLFVYFSVSKKHMSELKVGEKVGYLILILSHWLYC